jgi:hypothetical protein
MPVVATINFMTRGVKASPTLERNVHCVPQNANMVLPVLGAAASLVSPQMDAEL